MDIPQELISKIIMLSVPIYCYMSELKQVHDLIHKFSQDYYDFSSEAFNENCELSIAHKFGLHKWFEHYRSIRDEPYMSIEQQLIEAQANAYDDDDY